MDRIQTDEEIIAWTATTEGGRRYDAWTPNDNGAGVSWGLIQFNQKKGTLPKLLEMMYKVSPQRFADIFGGSFFMVFTSQQKVRTMKLDRDPWPQRFRMAAKVPEFQAMQRLLAETEYMQKAKKILAEFGTYLLSSPKARAMAFDIAVQYGPGGLRKKLRKAEDSAGGDNSLEAVLTKLAELSDTHPYDHNRRHNILKNDRIPWDNS